jgi:hypothetical protein
MGDSLDYYMSSNVCEQILNGQMDVLEPRISYLHEVIPFVCNTQNTSNPNNFVLGLLTIHGMYHPCKNGKTLRQLDPRAFNTTADRIQFLLPKLLQSMINHSTTDQTNDYDIFVQIGSNLWDLSGGCNNHADVSPSYEEQYRMGIKANYESIQTVVHQSINTITSRNTPVFWKYAAPVSPKYSNLMEQKPGHSGRTRKNGASLNSILKDTIEVHSDFTAAATTTATDLEFQYGDGAVDWYNTLLENVPDDEVLNSEMPDGRHFGSDCPSYVMFDLLLGQIHQYYDTHHSDIGCPQ